MQPKVQGNELSVESTLSNGQKETGGNQSLPQHGLHALFAWASLSSGAEEMHLQAPTVSFHSIL